jgi:hypothetical protein
MKRVRRRTLGLAVSAAVHAVAFLVLTPVVLRGVRTRAPRPDAPVMQVQLLRLPNGLARQAPQPADQPSPLAPSAPQTPADPPVEAQQAPPPDEAEPSVVAQNAPLDIDPLFRVPFRDAIAQADAALRAGLSCAHVDLQQLPQTLLDLCAAADRRKAAKAASPTPESPPAGGRGADLRA